MLQCSVSGGSGTCQFPESRALEFQAEQILLQEVTVTILLLSRGATGNDSRIFKVSSSIFIIGLT